MAERLASKQQRAKAVGTKFIIKPFADGRPGVASVYVQTAEMREHLNHAPVISIDGSRVKHKRGVLLATAKCPLGKLQIVAIAVIFGGETGEAMRALYQELGLQGIAQVHDDGTCYDSEWTQLMIDDLVFWVLCPWHKKMEIPVSIVSWLEGEPQTEARQSIPSVVCGGDSGKYTIGCHSEGAVPVGRYPASVGARLHAGRRPIPTTQGAQSPGPQQLAALGLLGRVQSSSRRTVWPVARARQRRRLSTPLTLTFNLNVTTCQ